MIIWNSIPKRIIKIDVRSDHFCDLASKCLPGREQTFNIVFVLRTIFSNRRLSKINKFIIGKFAGWKRGRAEASDVFGRKDAGI